MKIIDPAENTFETVMVDVTHRCNMNCANCYLPNRQIPDMNIDRLEACLAKFPARTNIRIAGAEPTMRQDLSEIIRRIIRLGHRVVLLTNGLRLAQRGYVKALKHAGLRHVYISLNGGINEDWYERIDDLRCADKKLQAVENIISERMIINTGTILMRGINEGAVKDILDLIRSHAPRHGLLRFKNIGALGRFDIDAEKNNLTMDEMQNIVAKALGINSSRLSSFNRIKGKEEHNTRLFPIDLESKPGQGLWVKITNWQSDQSGSVDPDSSRRGRVTQDFMIAPFFEHIAENQGGY
jgi:molybdenum cofactor biosynthesis enzyme MoaA